MNQEQQREQLLISYAFKHACEELERITGMPWDDWEQEMLNRAQNWIDWEMEQQLLDELSQEVEAA